MHISLAALAEGGMPKLAEQRAQGHLRQARNDFGAIRNPLRPARGDIGESERLPC